MRAPGNITPACLALICVSFLAGCDNTFTPFAQQDNFELVIVNGFLDVNADTQFVRVQILRQNIEQNAAEDDSISVTLANRSTFQTVALSDSIVAIGGGKTVHVFYSDIAIQPGAEYEISAAGKNGGVTKLSTLVPPEPGVIVFNPTSGPLSKVQPVRFSNLFELPEFINVVYTVLRHGVGPPIRVVFPYDGSLVLSPSGYEVNVRLEIDQSLVLAELGLPPDNRTTVLENISVEYELLSDEWKADREANDISFFAAAATYSETWTLTDQVLEELGYAVP